VEGRIMKRTVIAIIFTTVLTMPGLLASQEPRFTDNGDGTVSDNSTGLMWQQQDDGALRNWESALGYCEDLTLAGHTDWRLPDIKELRSIVDNTRYSPAIDLTYFPNTKSSWYWSSSTYAYYSNSAWRVYFYYGDVSLNDKTNTYYVRCVR